MAPLLEAVRRVKWHPLAERSAAVLLPFSPAGVESELQRAALGGGEGEGEGEAEGEGEGEGGGWEDSTQALQQRTAKIYSKSSSSYPPPVDSKPSSP